MEIDPLASQSHAFNFADENSEHAEAKDITALNPDDLIQCLGLKSEQDSFDVVIGGPPCQAYARVGRAKLREVADHPEAFKIDPRGNLYLRWLHYVEKTKPLAVVMENVPDVLNYGGHNVASEVADALEEQGYIVRYSLINSSHHGVPQMRDRVFLIGLHSRLNEVPNFPLASRWNPLPIGYAGTRAVALKHKELLEKHYVEADLGSEDLPPAVSAQEAIGDLPAVTLHLEGKLKRGARRFDTRIPYPNVEPSEFAVDMRQWLGFEERDGLYDHVLRYLPRDTDIFRNMQQNDQYPQAHAVATRLFEKAAAKKKLRQGSKIWNELHRAMVPPYPVNSFPNRWWKLCADKPVKTLMAHIGKDTYSHIHYDSEQARVITVREAARLQSFPDGFIFAGTMNPAFRQIGNAVPPLMAAAIARSVMNSLKNVQARSINSSTSSQ